MSSNKRRKKQVSLYLNSWLRKMSADKSLEEGKTFTAYIEDLIRQDLDISPDYSPKEILITVMPDGTQLVDVNKDEVKR